MAADEWLVRSDVRARCLSTYWAAVAELRSSAGFGIAAVRRSRDARQLGPYRPDHLAPTEPNITSAFHPNLPSGLGLFADCEAGEPRR
jgi:hypothetical protein